MCYFLFFFNSYPSECKWHFFVPLICISLMISILSIFWFAYWPFVFSALEKCQFKSFYHLLTGLFLLLLLSCKSTLYIFWILIPYQIRDLQMFSSFYELIFLSVDNVLWCTKILNVDENHFIEFFSLSVLLVSYPTNNCQTQYHKTSLCFFFQESYGFSSYI